MKLRGNFLLAATDRDGFAICYTVSVILGIDIRLACAAMALFIVVSRNRVPNF